MLPNGAPKRLDTYIDIPLEIALPHFVSDDRMQEEGPLFGNFKLVLQSVVCHRGVSVDSGHYISLVRANLQETSETSHSGDEADGAGAWLRFDDLSNPRVANVDIKKALRQESPYLLFYQVQPIDEELASRGDPPGYTETQSGNNSVDLSRESSGLATDVVTAIATADGDGSEQITSVDAPPGSVTSEGPVGRISFSSNRRSSLTLDELEGLQAASRGRTEPPTPDELKSDFLSVSRRGSRTWLSGSKSRPTSQSGENRLSLTLSRLTGRNSKDKLVATVPGTPEDPVITINEPQSIEISEPTTGPVKENKDGPVAQSKNKKEMKERFRSKSREPGEKLDKGKQKSKDKSRPERECTVM